MRTHSLAHPLLAAALLAAVLLSGCGAAASVPAVAPADLPAQTLALTPTLPPAPTAAPPALGVDPALPAALRAQLNLPAGWQLAEAPQAADVTLTLGADAPLAYWTYVLAAPFDTFADQLSLAELQALWQQGLPAAAVSNLLVDGETLNLFSAVWGAPSTAVQSADSAALLERAWNTPGVWALLPFEQLEPRWKVIRLDGGTPLDDGFDPAAYPLSLPLTLQGDPELIQALAAAPAPLLNSNFDPDQLTSVVVTGVTALVRGTASLMEREGMTYPAEDVGDILRSADILHVSNEVSFDKKCPAPYPWEGLKFCSREKYIELLDSVGVDVVELTGDHFADWGVDAMYNTLEMYAQRGWATYGGGINEEAGRQAAKFEINGNKIAFIGCNAKEKAYATASASSPGAVHCDNAWLLPAIRELKDAGYLPIVTFQHLEYYSYDAKPALQADFRAAAEAGAVIVSGSQAHQPHAMEFDGAALLHYGLGDLFFDQVYFNPESAKAFIDRHLFYGGRYINTQLITIQFVDYARPRLMTADERTALLTTVFTASGWNFAAAP